jgi:hypothetical protein
MDYYDALRDGGWLPDPSDRVKLDVQHDERCLGRHGGACRCVPRLVLQHSPPRRAVTPSRQVHPAFQKHEDEDSAQAG